MKILAEPFRSDYATDSASMQGKALALMKEAARMKEGAATGEKVTWDKPFNKNMGDPEGWRLVAAGMDCHTAKGH